MPVASPPRASTITIVVESHSAVPSDSGASVGIVQACTSRSIRAVPAAASATPTPPFTCVLRRTDATSTLQEFDELAAQRLLHHAAALRIRAHRHRHLLGLLE